MSAPCIASSLRARHTACRNNPTGDPPPVWPPHPKPSTPHLFTRIRSIAVNKWGVDGWVVGGTALVLRVEHRGERGVAPLVFEDLVLTQECLVTHPEAFAQPCRRLVAGVELREHAMGSEHPEADRQNGLG